MLRELKIPYLVFLFVLCRAGVVFPQTVIGGGNFNNLSAAVTGVGTDYVEVTSVAGFNAGDTILLIQMKGVRILTPETASYGQYQSRVGDPGQYEFLIIHSVNGVGNRVTFTSNLIKAYHIDGKVQIVKVPYFPSARVTSTLHSPLWDSSTGTGGVLALIVGGKLSLEADIDMTGKGFEGGALTVGTGECASTPGRNYYSYHASILYSGFKGEGIAVSNNSNIPLSPDFAKGKGENFNGGGGGNGRFSGGGGGGGFGFAGSGFDEVAPCEDVFAQGKGGRSIQGTPIDNGIFMGGGGGSSTYLAGSTASPGGRGGGIIIILADTLAGNGYSIRANGEHPAVITTGNAGAGGGGGGGSIALFVASFGTSALNLRAEGGQGGHTANVSGAGGGGGGGRIWTNKPFPGSWINRSVAGNKAGIINYPTGASPGGDGAPGYISNNFVVRLNGFLFNSIRSSVTLLPADTICTAQTVAKIMGTEPVGGTPPYTFLWQKSYSPGVWADLSNTEIPGINYTPSGPESMTLSFRRIITDSSTPQLVDVSKELTVIVQPLISDNLIEADETICYGQKPAIIKSANSGPTGGDGLHYSFIWEESIDNTAFTKVLSATSESYAPPNLTATMYYHRVVTSGKCTGVSNVVEKTVLPLISGNTVSADQIICEHSYFDDLTGYVPEGGMGPGSYSYMWLSRPATGTWAPATGINNGQDYNPDETEYPGVMYYRRVVYSGPGSVCRDTSAFATLVMHPAVGNNILDPDQTICSGSQPLIINGQIPSGGDGTYMYTWQDSSRYHGWTDIPGAINSSVISYLPPPLTDTVSYRRIVSSSACLNVSDVTRIFVHKPVSNYSVSLISGDTDTTVCNGGSPKVITGGISTGGTEIPGDYKYAWFYSLDETTWIPVGASGDGHDFMPGSLNTTTWFIRETVSGKCSATSNEVKVNVLPLIGNNVLPADMMICHGSTPAILNASLPSGGSGVYLYQWEQSTNGGVSWANADGISNQEDYQPPALISPVSYRRLVYSGPLNCCSDLSAPVSIGLHDLPTAAVTGSATGEMCRSYGTINMTISLTGAAPWNVVLNSSAGPATIPLPLIATPAYTVSLTSTASSVYTFASVTDNNGCQANTMTGNFSVTVHEDPVAKTAPETADGICGLVYDLTPVPSTGTGMWILDGVPVIQTIDLGSGKLRVGLGDGEYGTWSFWWKETNWECRDSARLDVSFWEMPSPVNAGEDIITTQSFVKLAAAEPQPALTTSMFWSYPGNSAGIIFEDETRPDTWVRGLHLGQNTFTWRVENGKCVAEDVVNITFNPIPEGFSPDNNGINDFFEIPGLENTDNELVIVNLGGAEIIRFTNYSSISGYWDGKDKNGADVPDGTYYYFLTISRPYTVRTGGYVIIKRKLND